MIPVPSAVQQKGGEFSNHEDEHRLEQLEILGEEEDPKR